MRVVVDTNVLAVANGRAAQADAACRLACVQSLKDATHDAQTRICLDAGRTMLTEYRRNARESGQPGPGDAFLRFLIVESARRPEEKVEMVCIAATPWPDDPALAAFDRSDRVFAQVARVGNAAVWNAVDSDWLHHADALAAIGVRVRHLCGAAALKAA